MNLRKWGVVALSFAMSIAGVSPAAADTLDLQRSGNSYHAAACPRGNPHGTVRCHARIVTDARGNELNGKPDGLNPNVTPSGLSPSSLRTAYGLTNASA